MIHLTLSKDTKKNVHICHRTYKEVNGNPISKIIILELKSHWKAYKQI